jgi:hypothetical protein
MKKKILLHKTWIGKISLGLVVVFSLSLETMARGMLSSAESPAFSHNLSSKLIVNNNPSVQPVDVTITGTVRDQNGNPIPGATISVPGTTIGTATDLDGKFSISVPEESSVVVSFIGYDSQTIKIGNQREFEITLVESTKTLQEVVVVGYGTQEKVNLTGAVGVATSERLENRPIASRRFAGCNSQSQHCPPQR